MKKLTLAMACAGALFAANTNKFELSPMFFYSVPEGHLNLTDQFSIGVRGAYVLNSTLLDQIAITFDKSIQGKHKDDEGKKLEKANVSRVSLDFIKGGYITDNLNLYGILGAGYEKFSDEYKNAQNGGFGHYGAGIRYDISNSFAISLEVKDQIKFEHADHHLRTSLGFNIGFGDSSKKEAKQEQKQVVKEEPVKEEPKQVVKEEPVKEEPKQVVKEEPKKQEPKFVCPTKPRKNAILDENGCEKTIALHGNFATGKAQITPELKQDIAQIADVLNEYPAYTVTIEGHTDNVGKAAINKKISKQRAEAVRAELIKEGVDANRVKAVGYGFERPIADNKTKEGRAKNRRIEAKFFLN